MDISDSSPESRGQSIFAVRTRWVGENNGMDENGILVREIR